MRVLLIEDNKELAKAIKIHFDRYVIDCAETIEDAYCFLDVNGQNYDIILLDLNLPDGNGEDILKKIRNAPYQCPLIILTARSHVADKIYHLDLGADDYISKPFSFDELDARCRAVLRRHQNKGDNLIQFGNLSYDQKMQIAWIGNEQVKLRAREIQLLSIFLDNPKNIFSKMQLIDKIVTLNDDISLNAIEVHIGRLRNKILPAHVTITAERGIGYRLTKLQ